MVADFIPVHRYPLQFKRLFRSIYLPGNQYVVHVDKSSGADSSSGSRLIARMRQAQTKEE